MPFFVLVFLSTVVLVGCDAIQQGPPIELAPLVTPTVLTETPPPPPAPPPPSPSTLRTGFKVWVPRHVTRNGDVYEGHFIDVSDKAPSKELIKPDYEVPKTPKQVYRPAAKPPASGASPRSSQAPPPTPPPLPSPSPEVPYDLPQP